MDVLIIAQYLGLLNNHKTDNNRFMYLAQMLENDHDVEIVTTDFLHISKKHFSGVNSIGKSKITLLHESGYSKNVCLKRFVSHHELSRNIKKYLSYRKKPDVVYTALPSLSVAKIVSDHCRRNKIKLIIDIQDLWPEAFKMVFRIPFLKDLIFIPQTIMANKIYKAADVIIAVSDIYKNRALRVNKKAITSSTIYLGTDLKDFDEYAKHIKTIKIDEKQIMLAYVGTLGNSYDLETAFDSLKILETKGYKNLSLVVFGSGPLETKFRKYSKKLNINVEYMGRLPYKEMIPLLVQCDIALNPIRKGGAQSIINKHADYAAAGLPVVSSQECPEYRSLIERFNIGFNSRNEDPQDMADKIEILLNDINLRKRMAFNHRKLAEERFDRRKTYKNILKLITDL